MLKKVKTGGYTVTFTSYSGMTVTFGESLSREEAETIIKRRLRLAHYLGNPVVKIGKGKWEIETPEDGRAISDNQGFLSVKPTTKLCRRRV